MSAVAEEVRELAISNKTKYSANPFASTVTTVHQCHAGNIIFSRHKHLMKLHGLEKLKELPLKTG